MYITGLTHVMRIMVKWDVRGLMLVSLCLQTLLLLFAPLRKRRSSNFFTLSLLCIYLLADFAANYTAGVITSSDCNGKSSQPLAFWSTFLLVHLGGPDSITAFVLQDNEFWNRQSMSLFFQSISAAYTFYQTFEKNQLWLPTLLMFACGFIKYYERTRALYLASFDILRESLFNEEPDPGPGYAQIMNAYGRTRAAGLPTRIEMIQVPERRIRPKISPLINETEVVLYAHQFFSTFKRLLVGLQCSHYERKQSWRFFLDRSAEEAFRVIEVELEFMYDILFTKASVVYNRRGFMLRFISSALLVTSFGLFYYEKKRFKPSDVAISYALLVGAIGLDMIAFYQLITSNWITVATRRHYTNWPVPPPTAKLKAIQPVKMRFVPTHNLIDYCLRLPQPVTLKIMDRLGFRRYFDLFSFVKRKPFTKELREHIFKEVEERSRFVEYEVNLKEVITARGDWALRVEPGYGKLRPYVCDMDYDQSLLSWHIATELCWCTEENEQQRRSNDKANSKLISDYMMYLVTMQPEIMYGVTDIGKVRLRDTCAELQKVRPYPKREEPSTFRLIKLRRRGIFFSIMGLLSRVYIIILRLLASKKNESEPASREKPSKNHLDLCKKIFGVNTEIEPACIKGCRSRSVLFDGCRLAKELEELGDRKWKIMSRVWVEMLTYAAVQCRPRTLAEQLSRGGEVLSFVWLLMAHFGLVDQFEDCGGLVKAKLVVEK